MALCWEVADLEYEAQSSVGDSSRKVSRRKRKGVRVAEISGEQLKRKL